MLDEEKDYLVEEFYNEPDTWEKGEEEEKTAFLATLATRGEKESETEASLNELGKLAETAGIAVLGKYTQKRENPESSTYFGKGFLEELSRKMHQNNADFLIVNDELTPVQARNIENDYGIKVLDRTEIILSIFHQHAHTKEAKLQVRLAELQYQLPRLRRQSENYDQEHGAVRSRGGSASRGMGEKQIEVDKRIIKDNIRKIKQAIAEISKNKETQRKQREKSKKICLVGYTNAGKSTLFNALTEAGVLVEDKLFATLDSTTRQLKLSTSFPVVISDTVGFISRLPHQLVASFTATLMEVEDADLLLHIVDLSDERYEYYIEQVQSVLKEIGADNIPQILVFNKIDLVDSIQLSLAKKRYPDAIFISALNKSHLEDLLQKVEEKLFQNRLYQMFLPYDKGSLASLLHEIGDIKKEEYQADGIFLEAIINQEDLHYFQDYLLT
ncbi:MAG TPA: GTPase HflX [Candidatus Syntrophosphaera thermopropionivorans]|nr:GTPase HflX [Candidatus Syntrophosphaera thermopropionivorans]HRU47478.1 GTPase HflX [Candidatus Syntrophosphaera sp.]